MHLVRALGMLRLDHICNLDGMHGSWTRLLRCKTPQDMVEEADRNEGIRIQEHKVYSSMKIEDCRIRHYSSWAFHMQHRKNIHVDKLDTKLRHQESTNQADMVGNLYYWQTNTGSRLDMVSMNWNRLEHRYPLDMMFER